MSSGNDVSQLRSCAIRHWCTFLGNERVTPPPNDGPEGGGEGTQGVGVPPLLWVATTRSTSFQSYHAKHEFRRF